MKETPYTDNQPKNQLNFFPYPDPLRRILVLTLLCTLCGIGIKECKRADLRLKQDKYKYERFMDSINNTKTNTTIFVLNNQNTIKR